MRTCNIHRMNTLRTFRKISTFNYEIPNEHPAKYQRTPPKHPTYTPPGVGADSSCPYFSFAKSVFSHYQIRVFVSSQTHFCSSFCGYIRICGHDKSAPTAANGLPTTLLPNWNNMANIPQNIHIHPRKHPTYIPQGVGADSSRPYPYITKYTYSHHRTRMFKSPHHTIAIDLLTIRKLKK